MCSFIKIKGIQRYLIIVKLAEQEGFEPPLAFRPLPVFETGPFSLLGIAPKIKHSQERECYTSLIIQGNPVFLLSYIALSASPIASCTAIP